MQQFIVSYGYLAVFILMLAESACIPVPSELTMVFAGALAAGAVAGAHLNLVLVVAIGVAGNLAGSYLAWGIGAYGGRAAWRRWGRYVFLRPGDIDRADRWFGRHGGKAVFFGRLLPVIRTFISLPAGIARMAPARFGIYTLAGCIPWTLALAWAGYAVGGNWQHVVNAFHGPSYVLAAVIVLLIAVGLVLLIRRRARGRVRGARRDPRGIGADSQGNTAAPSGNGEQSRMGEHGHNAEWSHTGEHGHASDHSAGASPDGASPDGATSRDSAAGEHGRPSDRSQAGERSR